MNLKFRSQMTGIVSPATKYSKTSINRHFETAEFTIGTRQKIDIRR